MLMFQGLNSVSSGSLIPDSMGASATHLSEVLRGRGFNVLECHECDGVLDGILTLPFEVFLRLSHSPNEGSMVCVSRWYPKHGFFLHWPSALDIDDLLLHLEAALSLHAPDVAPPDVRKSLSRV